MNVVLGTAENVTTVEFTEVNEGTAKGTVTVGTVTELIYGWVSEMKGKETMV